MNNDNLISVNAFASKVGVDEALIRRALNAGRFTDAAIFVNPKGIRKLRLDVALSEFEKLGIGLEKANRLQPKKKTAGTSNPEPDPDRGSDAPPGAPTDPETDVPDINVSKGREAYFKAKTQEIEYRKLIGDLVPKSDVYKQLFDAGAELRKGLFTIPDQTIDDILAAPDRTDAHAILYSAIERVLFRFASPDALEKKNDDEDD